VAGTAWLFCREELDGTLDYLFIDEAGQISLADALAMGTCARNLILLGDPQQLAQVGQAVHPPGAGASVLEHLLGDDTTIPPTCGLFIDETRRMHPDVCRFISAAIYEDRLESFADCANQCVDAPGELTGTGIRYVPVKHEGNTRESVEEAERIRGLVEDLLRGEYLRMDGTRGAIGPEEIMMRLSRSPWKFSVAAGCDGYTLMVVGASSWTVVWRGARRVARSRSTASASFARSE
jgi:hypothetical protein